MKLEPFNQDIFPEDFVQWARPSRPLENWEMYRACIQQWIRKPVILLFERKDVIDKRGQSLSNDFSQTIPHTHSWGGYLHFHSESKVHPLHGSGTPTVFCSQEDVCNALRTAILSIEDSIAEIREKIFVSVTDAGWSGDWLATPSVHIQESIANMQSPVGNVVHQALARLRKTVSGLPLSACEFDPLLTTFIREAQSSIADRSLSVDVSDAKSIAFPPLIGHFRGFRERSYRPETENPNGGKIFVPNERAQWMPSRTRKST